MSPIAPKPKTQSDLEDKLMERAHQQYPSYRPNWNGSPEQLNHGLFDTGDVIRFTREGALVPLMGSIKFKQAWLVYDQHKARPPYKITTKELREYMSTFYLDWVAVA